MLKSKVREKLNIIIYNASALGATYEDSAMTDETFQKNRNQILDQATNQIIQAVVESLPQEKAVYFTGGSPDIENKGFNNCLSTIKEKLK